MYQIAFILVSIKSSLTLNAIVVIDIKRKQIKSKKNDIMMLIIGK